MFSQVGPRDFRGENQVFRGMRESLIHRRPDHSPDPRRSPIIVSIVVLIVVGENEKTKIGTKIGMKIKNDDDRDEDRDEDERSQLHVLSNKPAKTSGGLQLIADRISI